jgi:polyisoprenoid-binding protein YceI
MTDTATKTTVWTIDSSHSVVEFAVKHMVFATSKGRFSEVAGQLTIDNENIENSHVEVEIGAASVDTRDEKRDAHLRSADFFDVENHPTLTFKSTGVEADGDDLKIAGDLTIRGVTRPVVLEAEFRGVSRSSAIPRRRRSTARTSASTGTPPSRAVACSSATMSRSASKSKPIPDISRTSRP